MDMDSGAEGGGEGIRIYIGDKYLRDISHCCSHYRGESMDGDSWGCVSGYAKEIDAGTLNCGHHMPADGVSIRWWDIYEAEEMLRNFGKDNLTRPAKPKIRMCQYHQLNSVSEWGDTM